MSLESRRYVATTQDIEGIVKQYEAAASGLLSARLSYLKCLIATTQHELGVEPRLRQAKQPKPLDSDTIATHLAAFETVHGKFYAIVLRVLGDTGTAKERNARSNFARSSASTVRSYIKAGRDITLLAAARVTKEALRVESVAGAGQAQKPSAKRAAVMLDRVTDYIAELGEADKEQCIEALKGAMDRFAKLLVDLGVDTTTKPAEAAATHKLYRAKAGGLFWPTIAGAA